MLTHPTIQLQDHKKVFFTSPAAMKVGPGWVTGATPQENLMNVRKALWAWAVSYMWACCRHAGDARALAVGWHACVGPQCRCTWACTYTTSPHVTTCLLPPVVFCVQFGPEEQLPTDEEMAEMGGPPKEEEMYALAMKLWDLPK